MKITFNTVKQFMVMGAWLSPFLLPCIHLYFKTDARLTKNENDITQINHAIPQSIDYKYNTTNLRIDDLEKVMHQMHDEHMQAEDRVNQSINQLNDKFDRLLLDLIPKNDHK